MTSRAFNTALAFTLRFEGGYVDHPTDPGGATNRGITWRTLSTHRGRPVTPDDVRALSLAEARAIYHARFWTPLRADQLPAGVDLMTFDFAVNCGVPRAAATLQAIVGVRPDGLIGPVTLAAVMAEEPAAVIKSLARERLAFLRTLKTWPVFGRGWQRRVVSAHRRALRLEAARLTPPADVVSHPPAKDLP